MLLEGNPLVVRGKSPVTVADICSVDVSYLPYSFDTSGYTLKVLATSAGTNCKSICIRIMCHLVHKYMCILCLWLQRSFFVLKSFT